MPEKHKTIDEELMLVIKQRLREIRKEGFTLEQACSDIDQTMTDWLTVQQLDVWTFSAHERSSLFLNALYEIGAEVS